MNVVHELDATAASSVPQSLMSDVYCALIYVALIQWLFVTDCFRLYTPSAGTVSALPGYKLIMNLNNNAATILCRTPRCVKFCYTRNLLVWYC